MPTSSYVFLSLLLSVLLAAVHLFAGKLRFLEGTPRSRWVLSTAVLAGWGAGVGIAIGETALAALLAFLSGGIILNVLKEELPEEHESRFWAFALGGSLYAVLLLVAG